MTKTITRKTIKPKAIYTSIGRAIQQEINHWERKNAQVDSALKSVVERLCDVFNTYDKDFNRERFIEFVYELPPLEY